MPPACWASHINESINSLTTRAESTPRVGHRWRCRGGGFDPRSRQSLTTISSSHQIGPHGPIASPDPEVFRVSKSLFCLLFLRATLVEWTDRSTSGRRNAIG